MSKTSLLLGIHCHQPIDNFDWVILNAIEKSYKPFFNVLKDFPEFKISVHFSGWLLEFIQKHDSELFELMRSLSHQIEFFSGGYYEPILASIPSRDRIAQIKKLNKFIKKHFNQQPSGLWLTERVWDNSIISDLKKCDIEYAIVDDYHFIASGYDKNNLKGYFLSEDGGDSIGLFPINQALRYAIPFYPIKDTMQLIDGFKEIEGKNAAIIFDDGEKFGIWPKTYESVYEKEWLRRFMKECLEDDAIVCETYKEYFTRNKPISLAYLPTVSYAEMGEWSLHAKDTLTIEKLWAQHEDAKVFIKGGIWKNFLTKYQESNWIHKRVLSLSKKQLSCKEYKEALYKAECNDVLWHGVFGGIYLPNLRDNAYKYIIECEKLLDLHYEVEDIDYDGDDEYKYSIGNLVTILSAHNGAQIYELDLKDRLYNLQNTLTRYEEAYHSKIEVRKKEEVTVEKIEDEEVDEDDEIATIHENRLLVEEPVDLYYDWYFKKSAIDHISDESFNMYNFKSSSFREYADFANQPFELVSEGNKRVSFKREGGIYKESKHGTTLEKSYKFKNESITLNTSLSSTCKDSLKHISEWNFHFADMELVTFNGIELDDFITIESNKLVIEDRYINKTLTFKFDKELEIIIFATQSVSQNEEGIEFTTQGITFGFIQSFEGSFESEISLKITDLSI